MPGHDPGQEMFFPGGQRLWAVNPYPMSSLTRLVLELGPLLVFFVVNSTAGLVVATAAFLPLTLLAVAGYWKLERRMPVLPLVGAAFVLVFGGLTVVLGDETFIKIKPTIANLFFAVGLAAGWLMGRNPLSLLMRGTVEMTETGWRILTWRWVAFFLAMALINEAAWRSLSTDQWVNVKVFVYLPLAFLFAALQTPLMMKHRLPVTEAPESARD